MFSPYTWGTGNIYLLLFTYNCPIRRPAALLRVLVTALPLPFQIIPIYGRGGDNTDPRSRTSETEADDLKDADYPVPDRPAGQRSVPVQVCPNRDLPPSGAHPLIATDHWLSRIEVSYQGLHALLRTKLTVRKLAVKRGRGDPS